MALVKGTNAYVDVSEADAYFSTRLGANAWGESTIADKEAALVTASQVLDDMKWLGTKVSATQLLAFPRNIPDVTETLPIQFVRAVFEQALHLILNPELMTDTGGVQDLSVGPIRLTNISNPRIFPLYVERLIAPYVYSSGNVPVVRTWWRAN